MTGYVVTRWYRAPEVIYNWMHYSQTGSNFLFFEDNFILISLTIEQNSKVLFFFFSYNSTCLLRPQWICGLLPAYWLRCLLTRCFSQGMTVSSHMLLIMLWQYIWGLRGDETFSFMTIFQKGIDFFNNYVKNATLEGYKYDNGKRGFDTSLFSALLFIMSLNQLLQVLINWRKSCI